MKVKLTDEELLQVYSALFPFIKLEPGNTVVVPCGSKFWKYTDDRGYVRFMRTDDGWRCENLGLEIEMKKI